MRTQGPSANDILALFDRMGDPFAEHASTDRVKEGTTGSPAEAGQTQEPAEQPLPPENKLGFDREDRAVLAQRPQETTRAQDKRDNNASSDKRDPNKSEAGNKENPASAESFAKKAEQLSNKLQDGLKQGWAVFAKLTHLSKGTAGKESSQETAPQQEGGVKSALAQVKAGIAGKTEQAETASPHPSNIGSISTENEPQQPKAQDKIDFREELRAFDGGREGRKLERPRDGKDAPEILRSELAENPELKELVGHWHPESCQAEEEQQRANALRIEDALGEQMRCRGTLEDGTRCIRKPVLGIPYCREHASAVYTGSLDAGFVIGVPSGTSGPPEVTEPEAVAYTSGTEDIGEIEPSVENVDPTLPDVPAFGEVVTD